MTGAAVNGETRGYATINVKEYHPLKGEPDAPRSRQSTELLLPTTSNILDQLSRFIVFVGRIRFNTIHFGYPRSGSAVKWENLYVYIYVRYTEAKVVSLASSGCCWQSCQIGLFIIHSATFYLTCARIFQEKPKILWLTEGSWVRWTVELFYS